MKKKSFKTGLITGLLLVAAGHSHLASAHSYSGNLSAGLLPILAPLGASTTDTFYISCFLDPAEPSQNPADHLYLDINNQSIGGGVMSAQAILVNPSTGNITATTVTDLINGDNLPSDGRKLKVTPAPLQNVSFIVTVSHTAAGQQLYTMDYHCQDSNNVHVGTTDGLVPLQNQ
jgi:hypothetical protein